MNTAHVIPKEELPKYRRWKLDSLDSAAESDSKKNAESPEPVKPGNANENNLPTEEQIKNIYQQAKEEGYAAGIEEGRVTGRQEGRQIAAVETKTEVARIQELISELGRALHEADQQIAHDLLNLALELAKKMTTQALKIHPELILPIIQEAIRHLPHSTQHPRLVLHPDDAAMVRSYLDDQLSHPDWEIQENEQMEKGGCRIEAKDSEIDSSLSTRWQQVLATIGHDNSWLDQETQNDT